MRVSTLRGLMSCFDLKPAHGIVFFTTFSFSEHSTLLLVNLYVAGNVQLQSKWWWGRHHAHHTPRTPHTTHHTHTHTHTRHVTSEDKTRQKPQRIEQVLCRTELLAVLSVLRWRRPTTRPRRALAASDMSKTAPHRTRPTTNLRHVRVLEENCWALSDTEWAVVNVRVQLCKRKPRPGA